MKSSLLVAAATTSCAHAFVSSPAPSRTAMSLNMGLFDGVKEAFGADGMGELDAERETPIDRWMGWNTKPEGTPQEAVGSKGTSVYYFSCTHDLCIFFVSKKKYKYLTMCLSAYQITEPDNFIDSMDTNNYITASLTKPMGIVFEENDAEFGGIFVLEISEEGSASADGTVRPGDQLVSVGDKKVSGLQFEEALGTIIDSTDESVKLNFFRGPAKFLYGPAGASQEWLDEFIKGEEKVEAA